MYSLPIVIFHLFRLHPHAESGEHEGCETATFADVDGNILIDGVAQWYCAKDFYYLHHKACLIMKSELCIWHVAFCHLLSSLSIRSFS